MLREDAARIIQEGISLSLDIYSTFFYFVNLFNNSEMSIDSSLYKAIRVHLLFGFAESKGENQVSTYNGQKRSFEITTKSITNLIVPDKSTVRSFNVRNFYLIQPNVIYF